MISGFFYHLEVVQSVQRMDLEKPPAKKHLWKEL